MPPRCAAAFVLASAVLALSASPASGEVPSVDAYAGQALVLGKSHRPSGGSHTSPTGRPTKSGGQANSGGGTSGRSGSQGTGQPGSPERKTSAGKAAGEGSTSRREGGESGNPTNGKVEGARGAMGGGAQPASAAGSSTFSQLDLILLIAGLVCLAGMAAFLRRARRAN